jgi:tRNA (guanine-N7-)-methyltransferase
MGKDKLKRFAENEGFANLIQPRLVYPLQDHELKGKWNKLFFKNNNPVVLELGCGRGEYTTTLARKFRDRNFIGIDWKGARLWRGAKTGMEENMMNVGFLRIQIQDLVTFFAPGEVEEIWITFPDPHMHTSRDRKRITSPRFLNMYRKCIKENGIVHLKTDSRLLYDYTLEILANEKIIPLLSTPDLYSCTTDEVLSIKTTYEKIWLKEGAKICYIKFILNGKE